MIVNLVSEGGTAGPFTEPRSDLGMYYDTVDQYGVEGDYDNPIPTSYQKLIQQSGCIGFPKGGNGMGLPKTPGDSTIWALRN